VRILHVSGETVEEMGPEDVRKAVASAEGLVWIDFDHTEESGTAMVADLFDVRAADVADCHVCTPVPKLHLYPDHHYSSINGLARSTDGRLYFEPLKTFQPSGVAQAPDRNRTLYGALPIADEELAELVGSGVRVFLRAYRPERRAR
jgi:hypothetical protein